MPLFYGIKTPIVEQLRIDYSLLSTLPIEPVPQDCLHITLVYVGKSRVKAEAILEIERNLSQIPKFRIIAGPEIDLFPSISKPRALVLKVQDPTKSLMKLRNLIMTILNKHNVKIEDRYTGEFKPHITLGHIRAKMDYNAAVELLETAQDLFKNFKIEITVDRVELIDSTGGTYKVVQYYPLFSS
jgi:2'-5' RNA ligase